MRWPRDCSAAISLTYDDGYDTHKAAMDDLQQAGFRGTFYLHVKTVLTKTELWKMAFRNHHEIGNHTYAHPSEGCNQNDLCNYKSNWSKFEDEEIVRAETWLDENIGKRNGERTFAYPCGHYFKNDPDPKYKHAYEEVVKKYFVAARDSVRHSDAGTYAPNHPENVFYRDRYHVGAVDVSGLQLDPMMTHCKEALDVGGWSVLVFHAIGEDCVPHTDPNVHLGLIKYLETHERDYWVAPLINVANYIFSNWRND